MFSNKAYRTKTTTKKWRCEVKSVLRTDADWEVALMLGCVGCWIPAASGKLMGNEYKTSTYQYTGEWQWPNTSE